MKKKIFLLPLLLVTTFFTAYSQDFDFQQIGDDIDGEATDDKSGWSMALSADGNTVVIGATRNDGNGNESGHVRVYGKNADVWTQIGNDIDGDAAENFMGKAVAVSDDGSVIAVGASGNDANFFNAGQVKIFENINGNWSQIGNDILGEAFGNQFGEAIDLSSNGNIVAIGASYHDNNGNDSAGHVRVFENVNGTWTQLGNSIGGDAEFDYSGRRLSMSSDGSIIAIAAPFNDANGSNTGQVKIYRYDNNAWAQVGSDILGRSDLDNFGWSVSLNADGTIVAIGASFNDDNGSNAGYVSIYKNINNAWTQLGSDIYGEASGDLFGYSTSLNDDGNVLAVSGINNDGGGNNAGYVEVYKYENTIWEQIGTDIEGEAADDKSGYRVSLSDDGTFLAISAINNDANGSNSGHVRTYEFKPVLSVEDISLNENAVVFYPNPSSGTIIFNENVRLDEISLFNIEGKKIFTQDMENKTTLDVSNLASGVYILKIKTVEKTLITRRLVRQ